VTQATYEQSQTADLAFAQAKIEKSPPTHNSRRPTLLAIFRYGKKAKSPKQQYDAAKANAASLPPAR